MVEISMEGRNMYIAENYLGKNSKMFENVNVANISEILTHRLLKHNMTVYAIDVF